MVKKEEDLIYEEEKKEYEFNEEIILKENENLQKMFVIFFWIFNIFVVEYKKFSEQGVFSLDEVENQLNQINKVFTSFENQKKEVKKNNFFREDDKKSDSFAKSQMILTQIESFKNPKYMKNKSDHSSEEDEDFFFETQRQKIKNPLIKIDESPKRKPKLKKNEKDKPEKDPQFLNNDNQEKDLPLIAQILKNKNKKNLDAEKELEDEKEEEDEFMASRKFKQQLMLEELERKKREEREKNLKELKMLEEKFKHDIEENKRKKKEKKKKMLDEKAMKILEER
jgi:hypothetical protein